MRERSGCLIILIIGIGVCLTMGIIFNNFEKNMAVGMFGGLATGFTMMYYTMKFADHQYDKETKRLEKENKYRKTVKCSNCGKTHYFTPQKGVCMLNFLTDKKCEYCKCELKNQEIISE